MQNRDLPMQGAVFNIMACSRKGDTIDKGTWVRLLHPLVEGRLESGFEGMDVGHGLRVQLVHTNVERGYIDFKRIRGIEP